MGSTSVCFVRKEVASVTARTFSPHALGVGEAAALRSDLRTSGFAAGDVARPFAARIAVAGRLDSVGDGALGLASAASSVPVANFESRFTRALSGLEFTSRFARSGEGVPHTFRVEGAGTDVGEVAVSTLGATGTVAGVPLAVTVGKAVSRVTPEGAGDLASLSETVPLASRLGIAGRLVGHGLAAHDAERLGAVPLAEGVFFTRTFSAVLE